MAETSEQDPHLRIAADVQVKFSFYVVGLTFGVLALSVQTAEFVAPLAARIAELSSWLFLTISALAGLSRLEWMPKAHQLTGLQGNLETRAFELEKARVEGHKSFYVTTQQRDVPLADLISQVQNDHVLLKKTIDEVDRAGSRKYSLQKYSLVLGMVGLVIARGVGPLMAILRDLR